MKKKLVCLVLCIFLISVLPGCSGGTEADRTVRIAYLAGEASAAFSETLSENIYDLFDGASDDDIRYEVTVYYADGSHERQVSQAMVCSDLHFDLIIIDPADPFRAEELLEYCTDTSVTELTDEEKEAFELNVINESYAEGGVSAEPEYIVSGVYDPPKEITMTNVVFCGNIPVHGEDGGRITAYAGYDVYEQAGLLVSEICGRIGDPDINGDGSILFAFAGTDSLNPVNQVMLDEVTRLLQEEYPDSKAAFTLQYPGNDDNFVERLKSNMTGKNVPSDILIALDDRAMTLFNDFAHTCGYEADEKSRNPMTFTPGENVFFTGFGSDERSFSMYDEGRVLCLIGADADELATSVVSAAMEVLSGSSSGDIILSPYVYETSSPAEGE